MKAVDPSLEVSVIGGDILLPDAMTPKPDPDPTALVIHPLNGSPGKHSASGNGYINGDAKSVVNGQGKGDSEKCNNVVNKTIGIQNGVVIQCSPRKERSEPFLNGVVKNGYDRGDEEKHSLESLVETEPEHETVVAVSRSRSPPENIPRGGGVYDGLTVDSGLESAASSWDRTVAEAKEHAVARLQDELRRAREELKLRDEEVERLSRIRQEVESELEDLTASLFQEAHNMVRIANERQAAAEKGLRESTMQVEVLTAEVAALKTLVLTSTPSKPNPHLHPQIDPKAKDDSANTGNPLFRKHRRSPSHFNLKYGRENSPPDSPTKDSQPSSPASEPADVKEGLEVDPVLHREFLAWKASPTLDQDSDFVARVYREDIDSCLAFCNSQLADEVRRAVQSGTIYIEAVNDKARTHFPKKCALLETARQCQYRMRLGETDTWHCISQICRNRIIAVCDFLNYLNYIQRGLVKSSVHDTYWEIIRLRKEMVLARLGLPLTV